jgi:hypothetical protein
MGRAASGSPEANRAWHPLAADRQGAKEGLVEMQAALDQAERVVGAAARQHR